MARQQTLTAPAFIGEPPGPARTETTIDRALFRSGGGPPPPASDPNQVMGLPGSRGSARGPARVVSTLAEASALRPGEILVAPSTLPNWTPLFSTAAAVVTETGGPLSHTAVVARERGVPAVVGAAGATLRIRPGQTISVDGSLGVVTLE